jgi:membrane fusion protein (multidrug efflux system)
MIDRIIEIGTHGMSTANSPLRTTINEGVITILFVLLLFFFSCSTKQEDTSAKESFPVAHPVVMDTVFTKEYVAEIQSIQNVELRARVKGFIETIHADEGKSVQAGQVLFTISSQEFKEELLKANALFKSAVAEAKVAEVELKNTKRLVEKNIVSSSEVEISQAKLEAILAKIDEAKSGVSSAQLNLSFAQVKAPFSGVINRIPNKAGSLIEEGTLLTTLSNNKEVYAYFNLSEKEYLEFTQGNNSDNKEVTLIMADSKVYPQKGVIETVESEIDKNTGTLAFRARFPNPAQLLKHGSSGKVLVNTLLKNALLIPQKSTFEIQENLYVYVVNKDNVVEMRSVVPMFRLPHLYVIQSGLNPDENIIYEGIQRVKEGDTITPAPVPANQQIVHVAQN